LRSIAVRSFSSIVVLGSFQTGDTQNFVNDALGVKVMIGYDNIVYGEAVPGYGNDGVLRRDIEKWHKEHPNAGPA